MDIQLKKGILEICVLASLRRQESYGYKIITDLSPYVDITESTLYPILKRLESFGSVTCNNKIYNGRLRKYYGITDIGEERIKEFVREWRSMEKAYEYISKS